LPIISPIFMVSGNIIMLNKHLFSINLGIKFPKFQGMLFLGINLVNLKQTHPKFILDEGMINELLR